MRTWTCCHLAHAVGVLLERSSLDRKSLAECELCGRCFDAARNDVRTTAGRWRGPRALLLNGRYRSTRRLGRGGMGAVYWRPTPGSTRGRGK